MANEEIVVKFGGDTSALGTALRGVKGMVSEAGKSIKEGFSGIFEHLSGELTAAFTVGGVIAEFEKLSNRVEQIKRSAETLQVSDEFVQKLQNVGKVAGISGDKIESMMQKFVARLPAGSDVEEQFEAFADKIESIKDPAERARESIEAFGKVGVTMIPILKDGKAGLDEMAKGFYNLSGAEIEAIEAGHLFIDLMESGLDKFFAEAFYGFDKLYEIIKNIPWVALNKGKIGILSAINEGVDKTQADDIHKMFQEGKDQSADAAAQAAKKARDDSEAQHKADVDAMDAYQKLKDEMDFKHAKPKDQLKILQDKDDNLHLQRQFATTDQARADLGTQILKIEDQILDTKKKISDEDKKQQKIKEDGAKKAVQRDLDKAKSELAALEAHKAALVQELQQDSPSIQDLANSGRSYVNGSAVRWQEGPYAQTARELLALQSDVKRAVTWGDISGRDQDLSRIEQLKKNLPDEVLSTIDPNGPLKGINTGITNMATAVQSIQTTLDNLIRAYSDS